MTSPTPTSDRRPIAYLRKSRVTTDRHVSWEVQQRDIIALAERHGDTDLLVLSDWNRSGRGDKTRHREGYLTLLRMIELDQVSAVYGYSLSRLARSLAEYANFADLCQQHNVKIRLAKEGEFDYATATGRLIVGMVALFAQMEAELAQERARDTVQYRRTRGDQIGPANYGAKEGEDPSEVVETMREVGTIIGTARALNERGVPTRRGGLWTQTSVRQVIQREAPHLLTGVTRTNEPVGPFRFSGLVHCRCGRVMTAVRMSNGPVAKRAGIRNYVNYRCLKGRIDPAHGTPQSCPETRLTPFVQEALDRKGPERRTFTIAPIPPEEVARRQKEATERLALLIAANEAGALTDAQLEEAAAPHRRVLDEIDAMAHGVQVEADLRIRLEVESFSDERVINQKLRTVIRAIELDDRMRPVRVRWMTDPVGRGAV